MAEGRHFAERMFPAPADHGIAREDRAVCTVHSGVESTGGGPEGSERWYQGGGSVGDRAVESIVVYPPTRGTRTQGDPFEPVRIGVLVDMDLGQLLADWIDPTILAAEDALNEGVFSRVTHPSSRDDRPVEIFTVDARGLPRENYLKVRRAYQKLVDEGCVVVLGPLISDNSVNLRETINRTGVACIGWTGAVKFFGDYCFTVANGDIPAEATICAHWCAEKAHRRVGFFWERGSSGTDYADFFRQACREVGVDILREVSLGPNPRNLARHLPDMREQGSGALVYLGYGYATFHFAEALGALEWDPPRIMGAAVHGIANVLIPTTEEVRNGLERVKWMPCTNGGPATYITFAPDDHRGYKGDFLTVRELRGGELHFRGYHRPQWPSNTRSPELSEGVAR